jgi:hypothetical protein
MDELGCVWWQMTELFFFFFLKKKHFDHATKHKNELPALEF